MIMPSRYELVVPRFLAAYHERGKKTEREISGNCGGMDVDDDRWGGVARDVRGSNS